MNKNSFAKQYTYLTSEERFRLIMAASGRGDETERHRLVKGGKCINLTMPDHSPYAHAFNELAYLIYIELVNDAAEYLEAFERTAQDRDLHSEFELQLEELAEGEDATAERQEDSIEGQDDTEGEEDVTEEESDNDADEDPPWWPSFELGLATGFVLRTKAEGWKRFCERLNIPPWLLWQQLPGFDRLQHTLSAAEQAAFTPQGFVRWMNRTRPANTPELTASPLTADSFADAYEEAYRQRSEWWGGV